MSTDPSTIFFPLRSNASALFAGPGVAGVRRRILAAGLLHDSVVLEDGVHTAWAGATGASSMTAHGETHEEWQTPRRRGAATGAQHYVALRPSDAPETTPFHRVVTTEAVFSWLATFEPFRRELPASAAAWLSFGHAVNDEPAKKIVAGWESSDRNEDLRRYRLGPRPEPPGGQFVHGAIVSGGYYDLAVAATAGVAVSFDRRHRQAIDTRIRAGDAHHVGGHYALKVLLPSEFTWADVPALKRYPALREYRAIVREVEAEAFASDSSGSIDELVHREYERRLVAATAKGVPFGSRVLLQAVGFILGVALDAAAPIAGGAAATAGTFVATELLTRVARPRWLAVDRRIRGLRNGL
jgi:hypothetical protein